MLVKILALHDNKKSETTTTQKARNIQVIEIDNDITTRHHLICDQCPFETDNKSQLTLHKSGAHDKSPIFVQCPMCSYNNGSEAIVRKHIEDKHPETFPCKTCSQGFITKNSLDVHTTEVHPEATPQTELCHICNKCQKEFTNKVELNTHISEKHKHNNWALLVGDSHVKSIQSRHLEKKLKGNKLRNPAASSPREGSAYTTTRDWPNAYYPDSNLTERVPELLNERSYKSLIMLTPSNNIKNIENLGRDEQNKLAIKTSTDTVKIAEHALEQHDSLEKVVVVELPPRDDSTRLEELTEFANFTLRNTVLKSKHKNQITIASLESLYQYSNLDIFGSPSLRKSDGIHLRGKLGAKVYTECILAAVKSAGLCQTRSTTTNSSAINEATSSPTIPTSNYYEVLSN